MSSTACPPTKSRRPFSCSSVQRQCWTSWSSTRLEYWFVRAAMSRVLAKMLRTRYLHHRSGLMLSGTGSLTMLCRMWWPCKDSRRTGVKSASATASWFRLLHVPRSWRAAGTSRTYCTRWEMPFDFVARQTMKYTSHGLVLHAATSDLSRASRLTRLRNHSTSESKSLSRSACFHTSRAEASTALSLSVSQSSSLWAHDDQSAAAASGLWARLARS
mmetsp:Transcript_49266/g.145469  ORF Transcript_49266/g.145469 Transcript_49266/m.145469 type:complete len:216 (+) Transcript_49266:452-1099(+)